MIRAFSIIGLETLAILLAWLQSLGGVRTDEAKTLLNIPYPHPPLLRWIVSQTEALPFQEILWRVLLASIVVQAVWFVWRAGEGLARGPRLIACASWLGSGAVLLQAGTITTAPVIAVFGLVLVCLLQCSWSFPSPRACPPEFQRRRGRGPAFAKATAGEQGEGLPLIFLLWLIALFTAYQAVLYFALLVAVLLRLRASRRALVTVVAVPLFLVVLYGLSNPLSLDRFVDAGTLNIGKTLSQKLGNVGHMAMAGGSIVGAVMGLWGIMRKRAWPLALSLLLVAAFVFLSLRSYYAIFFAPLFTGGVLLFLREHPEWWKKMGIAYLLALFILRPLPTGMTKSPAREAMQALTNARAAGDVLIHGSFGHEWQYESTLPIRKYRLGFLEGAGAAVCLTACDDLGNGWQKLDGVPVDAWVRR